MTNISERIGMIVKQLCGDKNTELARMTNTSETNIRNYITGTQPKSDFLSKLVSILDVNSDWLLTGRGKMLNSSSQKLDEIPIARRTTDGIPLIPIEAMAGVLAENSKAIMEYDCEHYIIPMFRDAEFLIPVKGDSMQPKYYSGDIVACKRLPLDTFFQWNRTYVVDSEQGILIKRVKQGTDNQHIMMVSENPEYDPFELERSRIYSLALVIGVVRAE